MRKKYSAVNLVLINVLFLAISPKLWGQENIKLVNKKTKEIVCSKVSKTTKYKINKGEYPASVLRKFGLEPVFGKNGSMPAMLKANNFKDTKKIEPGTLFIIPFSCEEQVLQFHTEMIEDYRLITTEKIALAPAVLSKVEIPKPAEPAPIVKPEEEKSNTKDEKLSEIVTNQTQEAGQQIQDVEANKPVSQDSISEALRYRLICEGEWTGSECITRYTAIFASVGGYNNRYDGVDTNALPGQQRDGLLLSKFNLAVGLGWNNYWDENIKTVLFAEIQKNELLPDIKGVPIEGGNRLLTSIQGEVRYEKGRWGVGVGYRQFDKLYYIFNFQNLVGGSICTSEDVSKCGVQVYSANVSSLFVDLSYLIYQAGKFRFDTELKYFTIASSKVSSVNVDAGAGQSIEFSVTHDRIQEYLRGSLRYSASSQNTSIERQNAKEVSLVFAYSWKLKDWSEASAGVESKP